MSSRSVSAFWWEVFHSKIVNLCGAPHRLTIKAIPSATVSRNSVDTSQGIKQGDWVVGQVVGNMEGRFSKNCSPDEIQAATLVAKGFTSNLYAWGETHVLKLFHGWVPLERIDGEYRTSKAVHSAGLPVPAPMERVSVGAQSGIIFERVAGVSMYRRIRAKPWLLFQAARRLAELHAQLHRCVAPPELPSQRERIANGIDVSQILSESAKRAVRQQLAELPDGTAVCHGDFHPENIILTERGPIVVDWGSATRGDALGDVACTLRLMRSATLPPWEPRCMHLLLQISRKALQRSYLTHYLRLSAGTVEQIETWRELLEAAGSSWHPSTTKIRNETSP
jgi:uncharacterized protein (TIGR02172 family)